MNKSVIDIIVIGAGHAGLCTSYYLAQAGIKHLVLEQGKIGETWRTQRWDSFKLNSANKLNLLPGQDAYFQDADAFALGHEFADALEQYVQKFNLSVQENCRVIELTQDAIENHFVVQINQNGSFKEYHCKQVVIASGNQNKKRSPAFAKNLPKHIVQLHSSEYTNATHLPKGNVLVVGSAQSGIQIAEDLVRSNRTVFLSTSKVGRLPRKYRGRDIYDWLFELGFYDMSTDDLKDKSILQTKNPQISGIGERGKTCSLQSLARAGVLILGSTTNADANQIYFEDNAAEHIIYADEFSLKIKSLIDEYIQKNKVIAPDADIDFDDLPDEQASCASHVSKMYFDDNDITSIVWATGLHGDYSYIKLPVIDVHQAPVHTNGISDISGLYFIGLTWLRRRKSSLIPGIRDDASYLVEHIKKVWHKQKA